MTRILPLLLLACAATAAAQPAASPHGDAITDCRACHGDESWEAGEGPLAFDHDATGFPLSGGHRDVACEHCHQSLVFSRVGIMCADCHTDAHDGSLGFDCEQCHSPRGWEDRAAMRDRHDTTSFPLRGAHRQADCAACHAGPAATAYAATPVDCYSCHAADYHAATAPDHAAAGFDHDCTLCHDPFGAGWSGRRFLHPASFPLVGAHALLTCAECHTDGFEATATDCIACHRDDYEGATDPDHLAASFPEDCAACHGSSAWTPAVFDHAATGLALTGAHRTLDCLACHAGGYAGTPTECVACHQADYDGTTDPAHAATGFPTTCVDCHGTSAWTPADWDHDTLFPIYSGRHRGEWNDCADCHVVTGDYGVFECIFCHEHDQSQTDRDHSEVSGYEYSSTACLECHPTGSE